MPFSLISVIILVFRKEEFLIETLDSGEQCYKKQNKTADLTKEEKRKESLEQIKLTLARELEKRKRIKKAKEEEENRKFKERLI